MIEYRSFHNTDPPKLLRLWHACHLGRGAALGFPGDAFDMLVLSEPYFDKPGLIVAHVGPDVVGYAHAGFGSNADGTALDHSVGVICAVMVHPDFRRQGIGRELVARAEAYLRAAGAEQIDAGESAGRDPFYLGLYGASEAVGFLESDRAAAPFFAALGYVAAERRIVFEREITRRSEPFDARLITLRRRYQFSIVDHPPDASWYWMTRQGRFDALHFLMLPMVGGQPAGWVTCWGMDLHSALWRQRTVGLIDLFVRPEERRKGLAKALVQEVFRRLKDELVTHVQVAARESDVSSMKLCTALGFQPIDAGVVYRKTSAP